MCGHCCGFAIIASEIYHTCHILQPVTAQGNE